MAKEWSLASLLYITPYKFLGILFQYLVNFVEDGIDVLGHFLVAFGDLGVDRGLDLVGLLARPRRPLLPAGVPRGHRCPPVLSASARAERTRPVRQPRPSSPARDGVDELLRGGRRLEQLTDVVPGPAQRLHRRDPHQVLPTEVEHHRVPRRRGHLARVAPQALPPEERPR